MEQRKQRTFRKHRRKPLAKRCKDFCRQFIAFMFSNIGIIGLVVSYTIAGALIFQKIETKHHMQMMKDVNRTRSTAIMKIWNLTLEMNPFVEEDYRREITATLFEYQKKIVGFVLRGYDGIDEDYSAKWSFAGAFLYSLTVVTTIGYGNISAHTVEGKIATIVYAIIGMPLFLLYLSNIGDVMARSFKWIYANCCLCRWCPGVAQRRAERKRKKLDNRKNDHNYDDDEYEIEYMQDQPRPSIVSELTDESSYDVQNVTVPVTICLAIMVGYICGGAWLFCKWEDWEFLDASYFCFISLSTIGFGDLVPGNKIYGHGNYGDVFELSFIFCSMYLMLGMALIAMCFNLMQEEVVHKIRVTIRTLKYIFKCNR